MIPSCVATAPSKPSAAARQILLAMGENSEQLAQKMEAMLTRFDGMAAELTGLGKQLVTTQESVDEVRQKQKEAEIAKAVAPPPIPPVPKGASSGGDQQPGMPPEFQLGMPRLSNGTQPIFPSKTSARDPICLDDRPSAATGRREYHSAPNSPREFFSKPPKRDFPKFDGTNPHMWFDLYKTSFEMYAKPQTQ